MRTTRSAAINTSDAGSGSMRCAALYGGFKKFMKNWDANDFRRECSLNESHHVSPKANHAVHIIVGGTTYGGAHNADEYICE